MATKNTKQAEAEKNVDAADSKEQEQPKTTAVAVASRTAIAAPAFMDESDFGAGFEGTDKDAYAIPFLQILQKMSPAVDEDSPKHIPGAKAGMVYNTVTGELYDVREAPLELVQSAYKRTFIQWAPRDAGGGFMGEISPEEMDAVIARGDVENIDGKLFVKDANGQVDVKKSNYWLDTRSHYVIVKSPLTGETMPAILALASTQTKSSKALMTSLQNKKVTIGTRTGTPATYANRIKMSTVTQQNDKGSWAAAKFDLDGLLGLEDAEIFQQAKEFHKAVNSGAAKADYTKTADVDSGTVGANAAEAEKF